MTERHDVVIVGGGQAGLAGLNWLHRQRSDTLFGVGDDAAHLAGHVEARLGRPRPKVEVGRP